MSKNTIYGIIGAVLVIGLFVGYAVGRVIKTREVLAEKTNMANMDMGSANKMPDMDMSKKELVSPTRLAPRIDSLVTTKDLDGGYNLQINTSNFYFTPAMVGKEAIQNTGHAHVFVNGVKIGRAYSDWFYISDDKLKSGTNTITVTLNANNHNVWWSKNGTKEASSTVEVVK